ncbi:Endopolyphosphatase [Neocucurbitaria cava]|uniref:Endopolyphosphatase n=1 Tax=Neocucurbitaria cava TaxID=798079 RepID=A0A9W9CKH2_9PLEO|nr:Endopolyphosphatase [Neocucurbitaria cava]
MHFGESRATPTRTFAKTFAPVALLTPLSDAAPVMSASRQALICGLLFWGSARAAPPSPAGGAGESAAGTSEASRSVSAARKLTGRFLHVTDFHPDPFYKTYSSTTADAACHHDHGPAGIYGAETSGCDSPFSLINQTFQWINDNIKDDIDFVIWTGDSARHDNDEEIPRTQKQVIQQNEYMVSKFAEVFGQNNHHHGSMGDFVIPVVPTFGNNDIMPHNIFLSGPNRWTMKYLDIWRSFIPEAQRHQFQQGGWFSVEVIPGKLAVISLNTIYFFNSNSAVDGCANKHEPGYEHMEWLRIQLQILRGRGMKAILMGHVPPARVDSKESWDETCWQKYALFGERFRDVIVGSLYGHMNIDHFMLQDFADINKDTKKGRMADTGKLQSAGSDPIALLEDGEVTVASASDYLLDLRQAWAQLPAPPAKSNKSLRPKSWSEKLSMFEWLFSKTNRPTKDSNVGRSEKKRYLDQIGGKYAEHFAVTHVAPSVVPNYFPTLRIIEYNITGLEHILMPSVSAREDFGSWDRPSKQLSPVENELLDDVEYLRDVDTQVKRKQKAKKPKKRPKKYKFKVPEGPSKSAPPGPAYSPQVFTWTRYIQYFANLTQINNDFVDPPQDLSDPAKPHSQVHFEATTVNDLSPHTIFGLTIGSDGEIEHNKWKEGKHGKHQGKRPRPEPHPKEFVFEVEYDTKKDKGFKDLTVRRWVEYARNIGQGSAKTADVEEYEGDEEDTWDDTEEEEYDEEPVADDASDEDDEESEAEEEYDAESRAGGHKKHKKHKKKKKHHASKDWFTFVKRAFVGTMDPHEIKELFGARSQANEVAEEIMEL